MNAPATLPPAYRDLLERVVAVLEADNRVRAVWVHGSHARGEADELSDLDVIVAVADEAVEGFGNEWRDRLAAITPTVMARRFPGPTGSLLSITPECLRFDMWVESASTVPTSVVKDRALVFDRAGLDRLVPPPDPPLPRSEEKLAELREWDAQCRSVAALADPLLMIEVVHTLRWILYHAFVEMNRPTPRIGLKHWSAKLSADQRSVLESLPTGPEPEPVMAALDDVLGPPVGALPEPELGQVVFPPEGFVRAVFLPPLPREERLRHVAEEFFAFHLYLTVIVHRQDWLLGLEGLHSLRKYLFELDLETQGRPAPTVANWGSRITAEQRDEWLALPTGPPTREAVVEGERAIRDVFIGRGHAVIGDNWPAEMEEAVTTHVDRFIGVLGT